MQSRDSFNLKCKIFFAGFFVCRRLPQFLDVYLDIVGRSCLWERVRDPLNAAGYVKVSVYFNVIFLDHLEPYSRLDVLDGFKRKKESHFHNP